MRAIVRWYAHSWAALPTTGILFPAAGGRGSCVSHLDLGSQLVALTAAHRQNPRAAVVRNTRASRRVTLRVQIKHRTVILMGAVRVLTLHRIKDRPRQHRHRGYTLVPPSNA